MPFEGYKYKFELRAGHQSVGNREDRHFHTFTITLYMRDLDKNVNLYEEVEKKMLAWLDNYQNRYLDETELFASRATTMESIGDVMYDELCNVAKTVGFELVRLEICENPVRTYSVSDRMLDSSVNEITRLPHSWTVVTTSRTEESALDMVAATSEEQPEEVTLEELEVVEATEAATENTASKTVGATGAKAVGGVSVVVLSAAILVGLAGVVMWLMEYMGLYPKGSDIFCHLYRADLILDNIRNGNLYPLYDPMWYNGVEIMRYWGPLPLYILAALQWMTGTILDGYVMFTGFVFVVGGIGWLMWGKKYRRPVLALCLAVLWFFMPACIDVLIYEGNIPRVVINALLPYLLYFLAGFLEDGRRGNMAGLVISFSLVGLCHIGTFIMVAVIVLIYSAIYCRMNKVRGLIKIIAGIVTAFLIIGIWAVPSLIGNSVAGGGSNQVMSTFFQSIFVSLDPVYRWMGDMSNSYFGISIFVICIIGIVVGTKTIKAAFYTALIVFFCTSNAVHDLVQQLPFSHMLWMLRLIPIVLAVFITGLMRWEKLKKWFVVIMCLVMVVDCVPSIQYITGYKAERQNPQTAIDNQAQSLLLDQAQEITTQRLAFYELSKYGSFVPYYVAGQGKPVPYMFGAGWEGAATGTNMVRINTAVECGYYEYVFDRSIEMGCDTILFSKSAVETKNDFVEKLTAAGRKLGYRLIEEKGDCVLFKKDIEYTFGTVTEYENLAIGSAAKDLSMVFPTFEEGDSNNLDDYTIEELCRYNNIFLSNVEYSDTYEAEDKLTQVAKAGVKIYIDMNRLPAHTRTNNQEIFGVSAQIIHFQDSFPTLHYGSRNYKADVFSEEYSDWSTIYLSGLDNVTGYGMVNGRSLPFAGTKGDLENITFLGYNMVYHVVDSQDPVVKELVQEILGVDSEKMPDRDVVRVDFSYKNNKIEIRTDANNVNTGLAYLDIFSSEQTITKDNNLLCVNSGTTTVNISYPYLLAAGTVSCVGILAFIILITRMSRKSAHN